MIASRLREAKESFYLVPSQLFFITHIDLPKGEKLTEKKIEDLVRFALESQSPFELSHLLWGFLPYASKDGLLAYATSKEILRREHPEFSSATYVFPSFLPCFLGEEKLTGLCRFRYGEEAVTFRCTKEGYWSGFDKLLEREEASSLPVHERVLEGVKLHHQGCTFSLSRGSEKPLRCLLSFRSSDFWSANLHDFDLRLRRRTEKRVESVCYRTSMTVSCFLALVFLFWIGLEIMTWGIMRETHRLAAEEPWVARLKQKRDLLHELALFSKQKQVYFRILSRLNDKRPDSILFLLLKANNGREFEIEGSAKRVEDVHRYVTDLQADDILTLVELRRVTSRNDEVKFSLYVEFEERV
ncbi:MAG: hypothetical protein LBT57_03220 [Puniceicoccales bacterium]|jgi:hypothetical protein|nr:hypothetical protein [Puniceicoccales bacterium]